MFQWVLISAYEITGFRIAPDHQPFSVHFFEMTAQMRTCAALLAGQQEVANETWCAVIRDGHFKIIILEPGSGHI